MATGTQTDLLNRIRLLEKSTGSGGGGDTGTGTPSDLGAFLLGGQSGGQIAAGGITNTENLTLIPSSDPMATGYVALYGGLSESLRTEQTGITTVSHGVGSELDGAAQLFIHSQYAQTRDQTSNVVGTPLFIQHDVDFLYPAATSSLPGVFGPWTGISYSGTHTWSADVTGLTAFQVTLASYADFLVNKNDAGNNRAITPGWSNFSARQYIADGATLTFHQVDAAEGPVAYFDSTTYYTKNGGTIDASTNSIITGSFISDIFIGGNSHFTARRAFWVKDINQYPFFTDLPHSVLGGDVFNATVDKNYGFYAEPLAVGTNNIGLCVNNPIQGYDGLNATYTVGPWASVGAVPGGAFISVADTFTLDFANADMGAMLQFSGAVKFKQSALTAASFTMVQNLGTFQNDPSAAANLGSIFGIYNNPTFKAASQTIGMTAAKSVVMIPVFTTTGGGVLSVTESTALEAAGSVAGSTTIFSRTGLHIKDVTVTAPATVSAQIGIAIDALTNAGANIGIINKSSTLLGSTNQLQIDASGNVSAAAGLILQATALGTQTADFDICDLANATTITLNAASINFKALKIAPTVTMQTGPGLAGTVYGLHLNSTLQGNTGATDTFANGIFTGISSQDQIKTQDTNARTLLLYTGISAAPTFSVAGSGSLTVSTLSQYAAPAVTVPANATVTTLKGVSLAGPTVAASGTVTTYKSVEIANAATNSGTFTTCIGIDIASLTRAGTNIGIQSSSSILVNAAVGLGYATGAGGTASQSSSKSTAFPTISKSCGTLTWNGAALNANTSVTSSSSTNTVIAATDVVIFTHISGGTLGAYNMTCTPGSGTWTLTLRNVTDGSLSEAPVFAFAIIKAVTS